MNLLQLILIALALMVAGAVFYLAWEVTAHDPSAEKKEEPDESKES